MLHEISMEVTLLRDRDHLHCRAGVDIGADQSQGTMALSTGVAHPCDMDCLQVAFSFRHSSRTHGFDGRREQSRYSETQAATDAARKSMKITRSLVSVVDDDESVR